MTQSGSLPAKGLEQRQRGPKSESSRSESSLGSALALPCLIRTSIPVSDL